MGPIVTAWIRKQLGGRNNHNRKEDSQRNKTAGDTIVADQVFCRRGNVNCRRPVATYDQTSDESATVRTKPFYCRGGSCCVAKTHTDAT
jgi:hypothetical protein